MRISKRQLRRIIKEEKQKLNEQMGGARQQERLMNDLGSITGWVQEIVNEKEYMGLTEETFTQLSNLLAQLEDFTEDLGGYFTDRGDHTV